MGSKENKVHERFALETLGKFYYDLAKLSFGGMVIIGMMSFDGSKDIGQIGLKVLSGVLLTAIFAAIGNRVIK